MQAGGSPVLSFERIAGFGLACRKRVQRVVDGIRPCPVEQSKVWESV